MLVIFLVFPLAPGLVTVFGHTCLKVQFKESATMNGLLAFQTPTMRTGHFHTDRQA